MFSTKVTNWKQLATTFQYLEAAASTAMAFFIIITVCVAYACLVNYHERSMDRRCPGWDAHAAVEQFSPLFFSLVPF